MGGIVGCHFHVTASQANSRTTLHDQNGDMLKQLIIVCGSERRPYNQV